MKRVVYFLSKNKFNILFIALGLYLSFVAHDYATFQRGYKAFGGEFLLLPLMIVLKEFGATAVEGWKEWTTSV